MKEGRNKQPVPLNVQPEGVPPEVRATLAYARILESMIQNLDPAARSLIISRLRRAEIIMYGHNSSICVEISNFIKILERIS